MALSVQENGRVRQKSSLAIRSLALVIAASFVPWAAAKDLEPIDAWKKAKPQQASRMPAFGRGTLARFNGHIDERLGVPTFLFAGEGASAPRSPSANPESLAREHLKAVAEAYRISDEEVDSLQVTNVSTLKQGSRIVQLQNMVDGIEVFRERVSVLTNVSGGLVSIGGYVTSTAAARESMRATRNTSDLFRLRAAEAAAVALGDYGFDASAAAQATETPEEGNFLRVNLPPNAAGTALVEPARVKPVWFRLGSSLIPSYYVEVQVEEAGTDQADYYAYVINAKDGGLLFRHNQTAEADFAYRVFAETGGDNLPLPGPDGRGAIPHPDAYPTGFQPPMVLPNLITLDRGPIADPQHVWLADGATETTGNNVEAYADLNSSINPSTGAQVNDGFQPSTTDVRGATSGPGTFDYTYDTTLPPNANATQRQAAIANLFYMNNWLHDWYYDAGFDEASGNAQVSNYSGFGVGNDSIKAEAQDASGLSNANMSTPSDGGRPRMQMYVFSGIGPTQVELTGNATASFGPVGIASGFGPQNFDLGPLEVVQLLDDTVDPVPADTIPGLDTDGCGVVSNAAAVAGKIALIARASCGFTVKVKAAQNAGALGVIIANIDVSSYGAAAQTFGNMGGTDPTITIPSVLINLPMGTTLRTGMAGGTVNAQLRRAAAVNRDGTLDNAIIAHEWGHYISNRLVQNSAGLTNEVGRGMGEGWADFHALLMMTKADDDDLAWNLSYGGTYGVATYSLGGPSPVWAPNNGPYYGIRRFPYSTNFNRNPLTFQHIADGNAIPVTAPRSGAGAPENSAVHNIGEVWASMLWDCYTGLLRDSGRLTFEEAQDRMKRYLVAGYKMTPAAPTMLEARDALLSAIRAEDEQDFQVCGLAFARRGAGTDAVAADRFSTTGAGTVESFTFGRAASIVSATFDDADAACDADGFVDNGETGTLRVSMRNGGFLALTGGTIQVSSPTPGVSFPGGSNISVAALEPLSSDTLEIPVSLSGVVGVSAATIDVTFSASGLGAPVVDQFEFRVNADNVANASANDDAESTQPSWTTLIEGTNFPAASWSILEYAPLDHTYYGPDVGVTLVTWLVSPPLQVSASEAFEFAYDGAFSFEPADWDGGVIEYSADGGATWADVTTITGAVLDPAYTGPLASGNQLQGRQAYLGENAEWPNFQPMSVTIPGGSSVAGQTIQLRFGVASDSAVGDYGWEIDNVEVSGITNTPFTALLPHSGGCNADLFGDGFE